MKFDQLLNKEIKQLFLVTWNNINAYNEKINFHIK